MFEKKSLYKYILSILVLICSIESYTQNDLNYTNLITNDSNVVLKVINQTINYMNIDPDSSIRYSKYLLKNINDDIYIEHYGYGFAARTYYKICNIIGTSYYYLGNTDSAIVYFNKCLNISNKIKNYTLIADAYLNIGVCYLYMFDMNKSLIMFFNAMKISESIYHTLYYGQSLFYIGNIFYNLGDYQVALDYYKKSEIVFKYINENNNLSNSYLNLAICYNKIGDIENSKLYFEKRFNINKVNKNEYMILESKFYYSEMLFDSKKYNSSLEIYKDVIQKPEIYSTPYYNGYCHYFIGYIYCKINKLDSAIVHINEANTISDTYNIEDLKTSVYKLYSDYYNAKKIPNKSLFYLNKYIFKRDSIQAIQNVKQLGALETEQNIKNEYEEVKRKEKYETEQAQKRIKRMNLLQYSGISILLFFMLIIVIFLGVFKVSKSWASAISFFVFLLVFEFLLLLTDPYIDNVTGSKPVYKLIANILLALMIIPIHKLLDKALRNKISKG